MIFAAVFQEEMPELLDNVIPGVSGDELKVGDEVEIANTANGLAYQCTIIARDDSKTYPTFSVRVNLNESRRIIL